MKKIVGVVMLLFIIGCTSTTVNYTLTDDMYGDNNLWFIRFEPLENKRVKVFVDGSEILDGIDIATQHGYVAIYDLNKKLKHKEVKLIIK